MTSDDDPTLEEPDPWQPAPAWHGVALGLALVAVSVATVLVAWMVLP